MSGLFLALVELLGALLLVAGLWAMTWMRAPGAMFASCGAFVMLAALAIDLQWVASL